MSHDLPQRFAQDWTCRRTRNRFHQHLVTEPKAFHALAEAPLHPSPDALLICKPLLANRALRQLWQQRWPQVPTLRVGPDRFRQLVPRQPAIGIAALLPQREESTLPPQASGLWLALRHVRSPGNLGTLIRSLDALCGGTPWACGLILLGRSLDPWDCQVQRASMGSALRIPIVRSTHQALAGWAQAHPAWALLGADDATDGQPLSQHTWQRPTIVLLGHERHGLNEEDRALCQGFVRIPQSGGADSLNVAMAGTVVCYEASRGRGGGFDRMQGVGLVRPVL